MTSLRFDNNWRRTLLFTKEATVDSNFAASYVSLSEDKLPAKLSSFCEKYSFNYGFDYDPYSFLIWPVHDTISAQALADSLNQVFPKCASVVERTVREAHGLEFDSFDNDLSFDEYVR